MEGEQARTKSSRTRAADDHDDDATPRRKKKAKVSHGRLSKSPAPARTRGSPNMARSKPRQRHAKTYQHGDGDGDGDGSGDVPLIDEKLRNEMELAKSMYPGASTWAKDEERMFEMLFLRQELPILPRHWEVDFRGVPISETSFSTGNRSNPIIYAHTKEFRATTALTRLIDLTANVRTACQSGLRHKAPAMIKKALDNYIRWAAEDGGFGRLKVVPNIVAEIIDAREGEAGVTQMIEDRMRALARRQREHLKVEQLVEIAAAAENWERRRSSWRGIGSRLMGRFFRLFDRRRRGVKSESDGVAPDPTDEGMVPVKLEHDDEPAADSPESEMADQEVKVKVKDEDQEDRLTLARLPSAPPPPPSPKISIHYRRPPPVVYGLFIVTTSVFLMTVDSAKGDASHVSFHVEADFNDRRQSVWNALTAAMVVCVARDEMMSRLDDFEEIIVIEESDPDA